jgi:fructokinase
MSVLGIETGGTKIVARLVSAQGSTRAERRWPTTTPAAALADLTAFVADAGASDDLLSAVGIAAFGPLLIDPRHPDCGRMLDTAKPGWTGSNLRADLAQALDVPVAIDTDVNAAALAERAHGAGRGCDVVAYLTVGTGIGAGLASARGTLRGALHPEIGHLRLIRRSDDTTASSCPFHDECAEGLAAGPSVALRLRPGETLADRPDVRDQIAGYLAQLLTAIVLTWSPHRIIVGGGVGTAPMMLGAIRAAYKGALGGYGVGPVARSDDFIRPAALDHAGLDGAILLARTAATSMVMRDVA